MTQKILVLWSQLSNDMLEGVVDGLESGLDVVCVSATFRAEYAKTEGLAGKFLSRGRKYMAESSGVVLLCCDEFFAVEPLSQLAKEAIAAGKAIVFTLPGTKNFPEWYPETAITLSNQKGTKTFGFNKIVSSTRNFFS